MLNEDRLEKIEEVANEISGEFGLILMGDKPEYLEPNNQDVDIEKVYNYVLRQIKNLEVEE